MDPSLRGRDLLKWGQTMLTPPGYFADGNRPIPPGSSPENEAALQELAVAAAGARLTRPLQPVGIGKRGAAFLIDGFTTLFAMLVVGCCGAGLSDRPGTLPGGAAATGSSVLLFALAAGPLALEVFYGRTFGRVFTDSRATRVGGDTPTLGQRTIRAVLRNLPWIVAAVWIAAAATFRYLPDSTITDNLKEWAANYASPSFVLSILVVLVSGMCAIVPPHRPLHDLVAGMAVYDESDLSMHRKREAGSTGGFEVLVRPAR